MRDVFAPFDHTFKTQLDDRGSNLANQTIPFYVLVNNKDLSLPVKAFQRK